MAVELDAYPASRRNRTGPTPSALSAPTSAGAGTPPTPKLFPFMLSTAAATRTTISSPRIKGPALIRSFHLKFSHTGAANPILFELGYALNPITENAVLNTVAKTWIPLMARIDETPSNMPANTEGFLNLGDGAGHALQSNVLNLPIYETDFFLILSIAGTSLVTVSVNGWLALLTSLDPQVLANFL